MPKLKRFLKKALAVGRTALDWFPLTPLGMLLLAGAAWAFFRYGLKRIDLVLLSIGAVTVALGVLAMLFTVIAGVGLRIALRKAQPGEGLKLECGATTKTGFSISTLWFIPFVKVSWQWLEPEARVTLVRAKRRYHESITPTRRGIHERIVRRFEVSDAFGFAKIAFKISMEQAARFFPSTGALKQMRVVRSIASGEDMPFPGGPPEGERADLRRYVPGDPVRYILWKVFAKSRQLVVRTPEQAISPSRQTYAYVVSGEGDEPAAGAARVAVDTGALGTQWVLGADGNDEQAKTRDRALEVLCRSASCPTEYAGGGLSKFIERHSAGGAGRVVVFVPPEPGPWLEKVIAAARGRMVAGARVSPVEFVVCTDGIVRVEKPARWKRWFMSTPGFGKKKDYPRQTPSSEIAEVIDRLASARTKVLVVDRHGGRVYSDGYRRSLDAPPSKAA